MLMKFQNVLYNTHNTFIKTFCSKSYNIFIYHCIEYYVLIFDLFLARTVIFIYFIISDTFYEIWKFQVTGGMEKVCKINIFLYVATNIFFRVSKHISHACYGG